MGIENLAKISKELIKHGRSTTTPAALIRWGARPEQTTLVTTLENAASDALEQNLKPPAIFIVGEVVNLREQLAWFEKSPLFGKTIVVTRARTQASKLTAALKEAGAKILEVPTIKITQPPSFAPLDTAIAELASYQWLIFTSINGVEAFFHRLTKAGKDARSLGHNKIAVIGSETAKALQTKGIVADIVPTTYQAEDLVTALTPYINNQTKILIPRAKIARNILPESLRKLGATVNIVTAYETICDCANKEELLSALQNKAIDCLTFTSSSTVTNLPEALGENSKHLRSTTIAAIGPITAATCREQHLEPTIIAEEFTIKGLVTAIETYYKE